MRPAIDATSRYLARTILKRIEAAGPPGLMSQSESPKPAGRAMRLQAMKDYVAHFETGKFSNPDRQLDCNVKWNRQMTRCEIYEIGMTVSQSSYLDWEDGQYEHAIYLLATTIKISRSKGYLIDSRPFAKVSFHALARRLQYGHGTDFGSVKDDLREIYMGEGLHQYTKEKKLSFDCPSGQWYGAPSITTDPDGNEFGIIDVRTFYDRDLKS